MITEQDIDEIVNKIVYGAEERYIAALTEALIKSFSQIDLSYAQSVNLDTLAQKNADRLRAILMQYKGQISDEITKAVSDALNASDAQDLKLLTTATGTVMVSGQYDALIAQTVRGLTEIIERQNIALATEAETIWYRISGDAITAVNLGLKPREKVVADATVKLGQAGITMIEYRSGVKNYTDVAVRRNVPTQVSQAGENLT